MDHKNLDYAQFNESKKFNTGLSVFMSSRPIRQQAERAGIQDYIFKHRI